MVNEQEFNKMFENKEDNFNVLNYWNENKYLIIEDERIYNFVKEKIGIIKVENIDIGNKKTITYSESSTFSTCQRKHSLEYVELFTKKVTKHYFFFGGLLHDCMEYLYTLKFFNIEFYIEDIVNFFDFLKNFTIDRLKINHPEKTIDIEELEFETNKGYAIIAEYINSVLPTDNFKMIKRTDSNRPFLETIFVTPVITHSGNKSPKFVHTGKIDGLVTLNDDYYLFEHKFLSAFNSADEEWLSKDLQINSYVYGIQKEFNIKITGVIYNVVKKPALRMKKGTKKTPPETEQDFRERVIKDFSDRPDFYFKRYTVWINQDIVSLIPSFIYDSCKAITESRCLPTSSFICKRTGCQFKEVCLSDDPISVLEANFKKKTQKHEEL